MGVLAWISSLFTPATELVKTLDLTGEGKQKLANELAKIQADVQEKVLALEQEKIKLQEVEAQSNNWLVAAWRPLSSLAIVSIILLASFGLAHPDEKFYDLAQWFLVGYAGGRSLEKVGVGTAINAVTNKILKK